MKRDNEEHNDTINPSKKVKKRFEKNQSDRFRCGTETLENNLKEIDNDDLFSSKILKSNIDRIYDTCSNQPEFYVDLSSNSVLSIDNLCEELKSLDTNDYCFIENITDENRWFEEDYTFNQLFYQSYFQNDRFETENTEWDIPKLFNKDSLSGYVNTILQGLYHCRSFRNFIEKQKGNQKIQRMRFCLREIFEKMDSSKKFGFDAKSILLELECFEEIDKNRQKDPQEFINIILNQIKNEYNYQNKYLYNLPFFFKSEIVIKCDNCDKFESILSSDNLFFIVIDNNEGTIQEKISLGISKKFKNYFNSFNIESCNHTFETKNQFFIYNSLPKILFIHIYDWDKSKTQKSDFPIDIPIVLNFDGKLYKLRSVCLRKGSCGSTHYTSLIYKNDELFLCEDSKIKKEKNNEILKGNRNAYIIFYELEESNE